MMIPKTLNIGSGKDFRQECLNLDKDIRWLPDIVYDLNYPMNWYEPKFYDTKRFGKVEIGKNMFEKIIANDVLEHIPDLKACMKSCMDLLKEGGVMDIVVPYDLSLGAWQDPTHVRAFNQNSWLYFTEWSWYLGWQGEKFFLEKLEYGLSALGKNLEEQGANLEALINIPRAVDRMRATMKKIIAPVETKGGHNG